MAAAAVVVVAAVAVVAVVVVMAAEAEAAAVAVAAVVVVSHLVNDPMVREVARRRQRQDDPRDAKPHVKEQRRGCGERKPSLEGAEAEPGQVDEARQPVRDAVAAEEETGGMPGAYREHHREEERQPEPRRGREQPRVPRRREHGHLAHGGTKGLGLG